MSAPLPDLHLPPYPSSLPTRLTSGGSYVKSTASRKPGIPLDRIRAMDDPRRHTAASMLLPSQMRQGGLLRTCQGHDATQFRPTHLCRNRPGLGSRWGPSSISVRLVQVSTATRQHDLLVQRGLSLSRSIQLEYRRLPLATALTFMTMAHSARSSGMTPAAIGISTTSFSRSLSCSDTPISARLNQWLRQLRQRSNGL